HRGFVLSDALQGFAPVSASLQFTNLVRADAGATEHYDGHACQGQDITVQMSDGLNFAFHALQAADLDGLALQIRAKAGSSPLTLSLSKVRRQKVSAEDFTRFEGFTSYKSPEAMADELAAQEHNLHRPGPTFTMPEDILQGPPRRQQ